MYCLRRLVRILELDVRDGDEEMIRKILCWLGWHENDLWLASFYSDMKKLIDDEYEKDWGWIKVPWLKFGLGYYLECRHCGRKK